MIKIPSTIYHSITNPTPKKQKRGKLYLYNLKKKKIENKGKRENPKKWKLILSDSF